MKTIAAVVLSTISLGPSSPSLVDEDVAEPSGVWIAWAPTEGLALEKRLESSMAMTVKTVTTHRGDDEETTEVGKQFTKNRMIVVRDVFEEVEVGKRLVVARTFEELEDRFEAVDGSESQVSTSPFEGLTVRILFDGVKRENTITLTEDSANAKAEELLGYLSPFAGHLLDFGPGRRIEPGDTWPAMWDRWKWDVLRPGGDLAWESEPPRPGRVWADRMVFDAYEGEVEATYVKHTESADGDSLALISFEGSFEADLELDVPPNTPAPSHVVTKNVVEGSVEWNLERGLPHRLLMTIRGTRTETFHRENKDGGAFSFDVLMEVVSENEFTYE